MALTPFSATLLLFVIAALPCLLLYRSTPLFAQDSLTSRCLNPNSQGLSVCATCMSRGDLQIFNSSNMVLASQEQFRVLRVPRAGLLSCHELLQIVYTSPSNPQLANIEFQTTPSIQKLIEYLDITLAEMTDSLIEIQPTHEQVALFQISSPAKTPAVTLKYSPAQCNELTSQAIELISFTAMALAFVFGICKKCRNGFTLDMLAIFITSALTLASVYYEDGQYVNIYATCLFLGICLVRSKPDRWVPVLSIAAAFFFVSTAYRPICFFAAFLLFRAYLTKHTTDKESRFVSVLLVVMSCIALFEVAWQRYLPAPFSAITQATFMCLGPLFIDHLKQKNDISKYEQLPVAGSGVTLPGFDGESFEQTD